MKKARKNRPASLQKRPFTTPPLRKREPTLKKRPFTHRSAARERPDREGVSRFPDEAAARAWLENIRWGEDRFCPSCFSPDTKRVPQAKPMPYWCSGCHTYFSVRTATVMRSSRLSLRKWADSLFLMVTHPSGVSSRQLHRALDIAQSSAWRMGRRIRTAWQDYVELFEGPVAGDDNKPGVPALPDDPHVLARALFWRHDRQRFASPSDHTVRQRLHIERGNTPKSDEGIPHARA